jgi:hypothetical protein
MAVVPLPRRSAARTSARPAPPSEILPVRGTALQVAAVIAGMINEGWSFDALPVTRGSGLWLLSGRRPAAPAQVRLHA